MKKGQLFKFRTPDMSFTSDPSKLETGKFIKYGKQFKDDRFIIALIQNQGDHKLKKIGEWYKISICESQVIN